MPRLSNSLTDMLRCHELAQMLTTTKRSSFVFDTGTHNALDVQHAVAIDSVHAHDNTVSYFLPTT